MITHNIGQIDKQVRESLIEYVVRCMRLDKMKIPVVGNVLNVLTFGKFGRMKFSYASIRLMEQPDIKIDGEFYRAKQYYNCYNTRQIFMEWIRDPADPRFQHEVFVGPYSVLSAWHLKGRYQVARSASFWQWLWAAMVGTERRPRPPMHASSNKFVNLVRQLPPRDRIKHFKRLQQLGLV